MKTINERIKEGRKKERKEGRKQRNVLQWSPQVKEENYYYYYYYYYYHHLHHHPLYAGYLYLYS